MLTRPRIAGLAAFVAAAAALAAPAPPDLPAMAALLAGTWLLAGGASVLDRALHRDIDAGEERGRARLSGTPGATALGATMVAAGVLALLLGAGALTAGLGFAAAALHAGIRTPAGRRGLLSLAAAAVPGALAALVGWTAATGTVGTGGLALSGVLLLWQLPRFLALGSLRARRSRPAASVTEAPEDPPGGRSGAVAVLAVLGLVPVSLLPVLLGGAGWAYAAAAAAAGLGYLLLAGRFALIGVGSLPGEERGRRAGAPPGAAPGVRPGRREGAGDAARSLLGGSLAYLPLVLCALVADARILSTPGPAPGALPSLNAVLNGAAALLLTAGFVLVRRGRHRAHAAAMILAAATSAVFLASYLVHHARVGSVAYTGEGGLVRTLYYAILATHAVLAATVVPLALTSLLRALRGRWAAHRSVARWTLPVWLYVSVTGIVVYAMLYVI